MDYMLQSEIIKAPLRSVKTELR